MAKYNYRCRKVNGPERYTQFRRGAAYMDNTPKCAKPTGRLVKQPMKAKFVINLKTAKQIGLTLSPNMLVSANRLIR